MKLRPIGHNCAFAKCDEKYKLLWRYMKPSIVRVQKYLRVSDLN